MSSNQQNTKNTNSLAIAGFVTSFIIPLVGLILSIISLNQIKKTREGGRGLAIAGIVISLVIPFLIIILLVGTTFSGIQYKARNTERKTDINAIHASVEDYHVKNGFYPTFQNINDEAWRDTNLPSLDSEALADPRSTSKSLSSTVSFDKYSYEVMPGDCDNSAVKCTLYILSTNLESENTYIRNSLSQQNPIN